MPTHSVGYEKLKFDSEGTPYFERTISKDGTTRNVSMEENGFVKSLTVDVIIRREGFSPTMERKIWLGLQKLEFKIPARDSRYRFHYLKFEKGMTSPCLSIFDPSLGTFCGITERLDITSEFVRKVGSAKKITPQKAKQLVQDKAVLGIFSDFENSIAQVA
jgi:hypothetical protein